MTFLLVREIPLGRRLGDLRVVCLCARLTLLDARAGLARVYANSRLRRVENAQQINRGSTSFHESCGVFTHLRGPRECFRVSIGPSSARASRLEIYGASFLWLLCHC